MPVFCIDARLLKKALAELIVQTHALFGQPSDGGPIKGCLDRRTKFAVSETRGMAPNRVPFDHGGLHSSLA